MKVPRPHEIVQGNDGIFRPGMSPGTAATLPLTPEEIAALPERVPFGFQKPQDADTWVDDLLAHSAPFVPSWAR